MNYIEHTDKLVNDQNNDIACPSCGSKSGHYARCVTLRTDCSKAGSGNLAPKPLTEVLVDILTTSDRDLLKGLKVKW